VFVAGARRPAAATASADQTEDRMRVRKRRNSLREAPARTGPNGARWNEAPTTSANAWQVASLNEPPDGRTRDAESASSLFDGGHFGGHIRTGSSTSLKASTDLEQRDATHIWNPDHEGHTPKTWASNLYHLAQRFSLTAWTREPSGATMGGRRASLWV
jgi:hypothetical protein